MESPASGEYRPRVGYVGGDAFGTIAVLLDGNPVGELANNGGARYFALVSMRQTFMARSGDHVLELRSKDGKDIAIYFIDPVLQMRPIPCSDFRVGKIHATGQTWKTIREALAILGAAARDKSLRPREWASLVVDLGLAHDLFPPNERGTEKGRERRIGVVLKRYRNETLVTETDTHALRLRLVGGNRRWVKGQNPHVRYVFETLEAEELPTDDEVAAPAATATPGAE